jgi:hypothetical protein
VWYGRTGWEHLAPVLRTMARNLPLAVAGGLAAWGAAEWVTGAFAPPGFWASALAVGAGSVTLVAIALAPPPVRRELARP